MPPPAPSTRLPPTVVAVLGLLLSQLPAATSQDACTRPCGREHTCGELNASFSCGALSGLDCDCSDCCLDSLSPQQPPPAQPPPLPSLPLLPPLAPGRLAASSMTELRDIVDEMNSNHPATPPSPAPPPSAPPVLPLPQTPPPAPPSQPPPGQPPPPPPELPPSPPMPPPPPSPPAPPGVPSDSRVVVLSGRIFLGGEPLVVRGIDLTLEGVGPEGATLDAEGMSRAIEVADGASLTLRDIHVVNGLANSSSGASDGSSGSGGGLLIHGAGSSLLMERGSVRDSVATGALDSDGGGGLQHAQKSRPLWPRAPAFVQPGPRFRDRSDGQGAPCASASRA